MANCCFVWCDYKFKDPAKADKFFERLNDNKKEADKKEEAFYFGSSRKYMFDGDVVKPEENWVRMSGWVKWAMEDAVFLDALKYAGMDDLESFVVVQEELGCELYGKLTWTGGTEFKSQFVDGKDWPEQPDDMSEEATDKWYGELDDRLEELLGKAKEEVLTFEQADELQRGIDGYLEDIMQARRGEHEKEETSNEP